MALQSGARTQLTGLVAAALVLAMLVLVPGLVQAMPQPVLAAVVITASISLFDAAGLRWLYRVRRSEFLLALACILGVAFLGVLQGIVVAVLLSVGWDLPAGLVTALGGAGQAPRCPRLARRGALRGAQQVPGMLIVRWSAPLFFANATQFRDRIRGLVAAAEPAPRWVVVAAEPIADIDTTAGTMLIELHAELSAAGIHFAFAELQTAVREAIARYRRPDDPKAWHFYASVTEAVEAFQQERALEGDGEAGQPPRR